MSAENTQKKCYYTLHYQRVTICRKFQLAVHVVALHPHTALTTVYEILLRLVFIIKHLKLIAQVDEHLILIHPIGKLRELFNYLVL